MITSTLFDILATTGSSSTGGSSSYFTGSTITSATVTSETTGVSDLSQQSSTPGSSGASTTGQKGGSSGASTTGQQGGSSGASTTGQQGGSSGASTTGQQGGSTGSSGASITGIQSSTSGSSGMSTSLGTTSASGQTTLTVGTSTGSTSKQCEEMQAVDKFVSEHIIVSPTDIPKEDKIDFQPTSQKGVSFPKAETTPTLTVTFGKPAEVQSVTIPRDKTQNANVEQFEVTFFSPDGSAINTVPIKSNTSPKDDQTKPAHLDSSQLPTNALVYYLNITILKTTDAQSPKGVILDIHACTEAFTGKY
jgi:hypothetical protein